MSATVVGFAVGIVIVFVGVGEAFDSAPAAVLEGAAIGGIFGTTPGTVARLTVTRRRHSHTGSIHDSRLGRVLGVELQLWNY